MGVIDHELNFRLETAAAGALGNARQQKRCRVLARDALVLHIGEGVEL
jgi:hypothetical protein